jgi:RNA polymerase sigma factor (TIGR02999 family)
VQFETHLLQAANKDLLGFASRTAWELHLTDGMIVPDMGAPMPELLRRLRTGESSAVEELTPALYKELHRIAAQRLSGERSNHTLQPTALVHEAYIKLMGGAERQFSDEVHFLAVASRVMRQVLVDYARARSSQKRDGGIREDIDWSTSLEVHGEDGLELLELIQLNGAIDALAAEDTALAQIIEMHYFGGMTAEETAEALGRSVHVVRHDIRYAQAWLRRSLSS